LKLSHNVLVTKFIKSKSIIHLFRRDLITIIIRDIFILKLKKFSNFSNFTVRLFNIFIIQHFILSYL